MTTNSERAYNAFMATHIDLSDEDTLAIWVKELDDAEQRGIEQCIEALHAAPIVCVQVLHELLDKPKP